MGYIGQPNHNIGQCKLYLRRQPFGVLAQHLKLLLTERWRTWHILQNHLGRNRCNLVLDTAVRQALIEHNHFALAFLLDCHRHLAGHHVLAHKREQQLAYLSPRVLIVVVDLSQCDISLLDQTADSDS